MVEHVAKGYDEDEIDAIRCFPKNTKILIELQKDQIK